jgi:hypothetical protein
MRGYKKGDTGQSIEALEHELFGLEQHRTLLEHDQQLKTELETVVGRRRALKARLAKIDSKKMEPARRAKAYTQIQGMLDEEGADGPPDGFIELVNLNVRIGALQQKLIALRNQELSKGKADSALAGAQKLLKPPAGPLMPSYRSKLKQAIWMQLAQNPQASNSQIVRGLDDEDEPVEVPATWRSDGNERSFWEAFTGIHKGKVEKEMSKVRSDLRKRRLLPPR